MSTKRFSKREALAFAWRVCRERPKEIIILSLVSPLLSLLDPFKNAASGFAIIAIGFITTVLIYRLALKVYDGGPASFTAILDSVPNLLWYISIIAISGLVMIILAGLAAILLIVPGVFLYVKYSLGTVFIIDQREGPIEALQKSYSLTNGVAWNLFLLHLLFSGIIIVVGAVSLVYFGVVSLNYFGTVLFPLDLVCTLSFNFLNFALVSAYRQLRPKSAAVEATDYATLPM